MEPKSLRWLSNQCSTPQVDCKFQAQFPTAIRGCLSSNRRSKATARDNLGGGSRSTQKLLRQLFKVDRLHCTYLDHRHVLIFPVLDSHSQANQEVFKVGGTL